MDSTASIVTITFGVLSCLSISRIVGLATVALAKDGDTEIDD